MFLKYNNIISIKLTKIPVDAITISKIRKIRLLINNFIPPELNEYLRNL